MVIYDRYGKVYNSYRDACLGESRAPGAPAFITVKDESHVATLNAALRMGFPLGTSVLHTNVAARNTVVLPDGRVERGKEAIKNAAILANIIQDTSVIHAVFTAYENCEGIPRHITYKMQSRFLIWQTLDDWSRSATNRHSLLLPIAERILTGTSRI